MPPRSPSSRRGRRAGPRIAGGREAGDGDAPAPPSQNRPRRRTRPEIPPPAPLSQITPRRKEYAVRERAAPSPFHYLPLRELLDTALAASAIARRHWAAFDHCRSIGPLFTPTSKIDALYDQASDADHLSDLLVCEAVDRIRARYGPPPSLAPSDRVVRRIIRDNIRRLLNRRDAKTQPLLPPP